MRMDDYRNSDNVEDRRGSSMGGGGVRLGGGRLGLGTIAIALVASYFLGVNPLTVINMLAGGGMGIMQGFSGGGGGSGGTCSGGTCQPDWSKWFSQK